MLEKEECNITYIPDFVEKRIYEKIFTMLLGIIEHALETSSINFMGHQIRTYVTQPEKAPECFWKTQIHCASCSAIKDFNSKSLNQQNDYDVCVTCKHIFCTTCMDDLNGGSYRCRVCGVFANDTKEEPVLKKEEPVLKKDI
jgi:hypothetical protein